MKVKRRTTREAVGEFSRQEEGQNANIAFMHQYQYHQQQQQKQRHWQ